MKRDGGMWCISAYGWRGLLGRGKERRRLGDFSFFLIFFFSLMLSFRETGWLRARWLFLFLERGGFSYTITHTFLLVAITYFDGGGSG